MYGQGKGGTNRQANGELGEREPRCKANVNEPEARLRAGSPERFGHAWAIFHQILPVHHEQVLRWTAALPRSSWAQATILDAGCGIGRNTFWAMTEGAAGGVAIDASERSVAIARKKSRGLSRGGSPM